MSNRIAFIKAINELIQIGAQYVRPSSGLIIIVVNLVEIAANISIVC